MPISPPRISLEELALLNELLTTHFGLSFPEHKRDILASRLEPRLRAHHLTRFLDYYLLLQYDFAREQDHLIRSITNNESYFFRETAQFEALADLASGPLRSEGPRPGTLRILSAGCSSGEEPYTLRIYERDGSFGIGPVIIDGVDLDAERLDEARKAVYRAGSLRALDESQKRRYFVDQGNETYALSSNYRRDVGLSRGNLIDRLSLPREPYDVIFCRNVLIYFAEPALKTAIDNFAQLVRPGGLLFLGHAESIIGMTKSFRAERLGSTIGYRRETA